MSNHAHKHEHCKHERLKFCLHCNTPYCLDCNEEWNKEQIVYRSYPVYTIPNIYQPYCQPFIMGGLSVDTTGGIANQQPSLDDVVGNTVLITQCSHGLS